MTDRNVTCPAHLHIGLDVSDRFTHLCAIDDARTVVERRKFRTTPEDVRCVFASLPPAKVALEVGPHSPWMQELLRSLGHAVSVVDARRVGAIIRSGRKTDRRDAEALARLHLGVPEMLGSIRHRGRRSQEDLAVIRARDALVRLRTSLINHVRGTLKVFGLQVRSNSAETFHVTAQDVVPEELGPALGAILDQLARLKTSIRQYDRQIAEIGKRYPETAIIQQVTGVGQLTATAYVLTLEDPTRFKKSRTVGSWLGLTPRVAASGDQDPELSISKEGDGYLRRLLVQAAHYILGPFGPDTDLRRFGLRLCERGGKSAKRRAVVAVARKLAVLLHRLWVTNGSYEPLRNAERAAAAV